MNESIRRTELSDFLRTRRARLMPTDVGLCASARRRTPGLRREEVALLANIGVTWYTRLEQGTPINVSLDVLERIAVALRLTTVEREHLFLLAGHTVSVSVSEEEDRVSTALQRVLDALDPNPAFVRGRRYDILAWNRGAVALVGDYATMSAQQRNILWRFFMEPSYTALFPRKHDVAQKITAQFRAVAARYPDDPSFTELINELLASSPLFREYWARHDVQGSYEGYKHIMHPRVGELMLEYTTLQIPNYPDMRISIYTADKGSASERKLRELVDGDKVELRDEKVAV